MHALAHDNKQYLKRKKGKTSESIKHPTVFLKQGLSNTDLDQVSWVLLSTATLNLE